MSGDIDRKADFHNEVLEATLDRSARELQLLANFYHAHGYLERAQELYRTIIGIRKDREGDDEFTSRAGSSAS